MAGSTPPRRPNLGRDPGLATSPAPEEFESERVRAEDTARVTPLQDDSPDTSPSGSRFAAWQQRRRGTGSSAAVQPQDQEETREHAGPEAESPARDTVVAFPPSSHRRRRKRRWITLSAAVLAAALFAGVVFFSPLFAAREFKVEGARLTNPDSVQDALRQFDGVPLTRLSKDSVRQAVGDVPQVNSVDVVLQPPHTVTVQLHERVGVATVREGSDLILVDSQGKQLATYTSADVPDVPSVEGGRDVLSTEKFAEISNVLASLPAGVLSQLKSADAPSDSAVELSFKDGRKAIWGDSTDSELKARVLAELVGNEAASAATVYDVSAPLHPTVR